MDKKQLPTHSPNWHFQDLQLIPCLSLYVCGAKQAVLVLSTGFSLWVENEKWVFFPPWFVMRSVDWKHFLLDKFFFLLYITFKKLNRCLILYSPWTRFRLNLFFDLGVQSKLKWKVFLDWFCVLLCLCVLCLCQRIRRIQCILVCVIWMFQYIAMVELIETLWQHWIL